MATQSLTPTRDLPSIVEGDDESIPVTFSDENGDPIDITGWTVSLTIRGATDSSPVIERDITTHDDATNGQTSFSLSASDTAGLAGTKRYDIQVVKSDGTTKTIVLGTISFVDGVTDRSIA